jgi:hypothetical protein
MEGTVLRVPRQAAAGRADSRLSPASAWRVTHAKGSRHFSGVSCPSSRLCVAVDGSGNAVTSRNPAGGAAAWKVTHIYGPAGCAPTSTDGAPCSLNAISCPSIDLCVAVNADGGVVTSVKPSGGRRPGRSLTSLTPAGSAPIGYPRCPVRATAFALRSRPRAAFSRPATPLAEQRPGREPQMWLTRSAKTAV